MSSNLEQFRDAVIHYRHHYAAAVKAMDESMMPLGSGARQLYVERVAEADRLLAVIDDDNQAERCEGGGPDCGPAAHWDIEAVPLCAKCWSEMEPENSNDR